MAAQALLCSCKGTASVFCVVSKALLYSCYEISRGSEWLFLCGFYHVSSGCAFIGALGCF